SEKFGKTLTLKIKYEDFTKITRSLSLEHYIDEYNDIRSGVDNLLRNVEVNGKQIRLLGVTISNLSDKKETYKDITLFEYMDSIQM
ncbi:DNA polymerase IV, partial [Clostridioides difficile]